MSYLLISCGICIWNTTRKFSYTLYTFVSLFDINLYNVSLSEICFLKFVNFSKCKREITEASPFFSHPFSLFPIIRSHASTFFFLLLLFHLEFSSLILFLFSSTSLSFYLPVPCLSLTLFSLSPSLCLSQGYNYASIISLIVFPVRIREQGTEKWRKSKKRKKRDIQRYFGGEKSFFLLFLKASVNGKI